MNKTVVIVGTGAMAATMVDTFRRAGIAVASVVSGDPTRAADFALWAGIPRNSTNLAEELRKTSPDAVYIANKSSEHAPATIKALNAGFPVLCEKPLALSENELGEVIEAARRSRILCMEGLWTLCLPAFQRFIELAGSQSIGRPTHLTASFGYPVDSDRDPILLNATEGGVLSDRAIYLISLALNVLGPVRTVEAISERNIRGIDQHVSIQLLHERGGQSQLSASLTSLLSNSATLAFTEGVARLDPPLIGAEALSVQINSFRPRPQGMLPSKSFRARLREWPALRRAARLRERLAHSNFSFGADQYLPEVRHFFSALEAGESESKLIPFQHSRDVHNLIDRVRTASERIQEQHN